MSDTFFITTPIYYVNDMPHIGHIYTTVMADAIARYQRLKGKKVYFLTGTDEHGQKIEKAAEAQGIQPIELADRVVARYHDLWKLLDISHDDFIRTSQSRHQQGVAEIIKRITAAGDIYKGDYEGWYDARDEAFVPDSQVKDGVDTESGNPVERLSESSYFFRLSAFQDRLLEWYRDNPDCIRPKSRYNEVLRFVEGGLKDLSISRTSIKWGVPYPGDEDHVVYVWLDALTNYISALGFGSDDDARYQEFWPADVHLVGKDILRFHCVYWPAFLMSAGLPLPKQVFGHGWWLQDDAKMSKSVGNVVRPDHLIHRFGADALRYFVAREMSFGQDANFSDEAFLERYNADLANSFGNTASRTTAMTNRYLDGIVPTPHSEGPVPEAAKAAVARYLDHMDAREPHRALESAWQLLSTINVYLQDRQPWNLAKQGDEGQAELGVVLYAALEGLRIASILAEPFMPAVSGQLRKQLGATELPLNLNDATAWGGLPAGTKLGEAKPLFPRVDIKAYFKEIEEENEKKALEGAAEAGNLVSLDDFMNVELKVGIVKAAERIPKSKKLIALTVDVGEASPRPLVAGIAEAYQPDELVGLRIVVVANLQPAKLMGHESRGMLLAASIDGKPSLIAVADEVPPGTKVR